MSPEVVAPFNPKDYTGQAVMVISYDDGLRSHFDRAVPLHLQYRIPATFAVIGGRVASPGSWEKYMKPVQIAQLAENGFEIASHGLGQSTKFREMDDATLDAELGESNKLLQGYIAEGSIDSICVPFSSYDERVAQRVGKYYRVARLAGNRYADLSDDKQPVRSFILDANTTFADIKRIIDDAVKGKEALVFTLHGISEGLPENKAEISRTLLEALLKYSDKVGRKKLLPIRLRDIATLREMRDASTKGAANISAKGSTKISASKETDKTEEKVKTKQRYFATKSEIKDFFSGPRPKRPKTLILAEDKGYLITYHRNSVENNIVIVSFGGLHTKKTRSGFGTKFALSRGFDHIFVGQKPLSQYQELSLKDFKHAVDPVIQEKDVIAYGSSLGGYCAVYFGGCINARIIASAPRNSAHPSIRKANLSHVEFKHTPIEKNPLSKKPVVVLYDPERKSDARFIADLVWPAYPDATYVQVPYSGHRVLRAMQSNGVLKDFIMTLINEGRVMDVVLSEENSSIWQREQGRFYYNKHEFVAAERHLLKSLELKLDPDAANYLLSTYVKQKKTMDAKALLRKTQEWFPGVQLRNRFNVTVD